MLTIEKALGMNIWLWIARHLPRKLRYWTVIAAGAEATMGQYGDTDPGTLNFWQLLERIGERRVVED